jgi:hypothetical protein
MKLIFGYNSVLSTKIFGIYAFIFVITFYSVSSCYRVWGNKHLNSSVNHYIKTILNSVARVRERTIATERQPIVGEVSAVCHVESVTNPYSRIFDFLYRSRYFLFQVAPHLSGGWMDPIPDPLLRKSGSVGYRNRTSGSVARNSDH